MMSDREESEDEEFDLQQFGIRQALPVDDKEPDWTTEEPSTVEEYLRRVRHEARQLPSVVTVKEIPSLSAEEAGKISPEASNPCVPCSSSLPECKDELKPSEEWTRVFLSEFSKLHHQLRRESELLAGRVDALRIQSQTMLPEEAQRELAELELSSPSSLMPELSDSFGLDQVAITRRILKLAKKIEQDQLLDISDASGLYALSARLERPLHGDMAAVYRGILRRCCEWRSGVEDRYDPLLPHLNILIVIAGAYFGQDELLAEYGDEEFIG